MNAIKQRATATQNQADAWVARLAKNIPKKRRTSGIKNLGVQATLQYNSTPRLFAITSKSKGPTVNRLVSWCFRSGE